jgi:hypothetical protein
VRHAIDGSNELRERHVHAKRRKGPLSEATTESDGRLDDARFVSAYDLDLKVAVQPLAGVARHPSKD